MGAGVLAFTAAAAPKQPAKLREASVAKLKLSEARANVKKVMKANEQNDLIWLPGTFKSYWWNMWDEGEPHWEANETSTLSYNDKGQLVRSGNAYGYGLYSYDDLGRCVKIEDYQYAENGEPLFMGSQTFEYDSIVKDYVIKTTRSYDYGDGEMHEEGYGTEITRNEAGNVTSVRDYSFNGGEKNYQHDEFVVIYGADGKAVEVYDKETYGDDEVEYYDHLTDIVWENTDGQILGIEFDDYNSDSFFGANRLKSAVVHDDEYPSNPTLTVEYDGVSFKSRLAMGDELVQSFDYKTLDEFGSFFCLEYEVDWDYNDEDGYYIDYARNVERSETYDSYGLQLLDSYKAEYSDEPGEIDEEGGEATVVYDPTYGYPLDYIWSEISWETGELRYSYRYVYGDYTSVSGVAEIAGGDAEVEYFNLQGVKVANPSAGLYIKRQGGKTSKVVIR